MKLLGIQAADTLTLKGDDLASAWIWRDHAPIIFD
jgi:hypothetical protein